MPHVGPHPSHSIVLCATRGFVEGQPPGEALIASTAFALLLHTGTAVVRFDCAAKYKVLLYHFYVFVLQQ